MRSRFVTIHVHVAVQYTCIYQMECGYTWILQVGMKLLWSSRNQKFIELTSLCDVYKTLSPDYGQRQTSYFLQTLWRDFTSDFDVIGPHYSSDGPFSHSVG